MSEERQFDLQEYVTHGVERVVAAAIKATLKNPRESAFIVFDRQYYQSVQS